MAAPLGAYLCLAASMALVGSYVGLSKLLVAAIPVFLLAWLRFAIGAAAMLHWLPRPSGEPALSAHDRKLLFWESLLGNFLFSICMLFGVALTSALAAGVTMAALPAAVALLSRAFLGERIPGRMLLAIALAAAGIAALAVARHVDATAPATSIWGQMLLVGAVFCEASYVVIGKRLATNVSPQRISALINLWGLALMTPLGLWQAWHFDFSSVALPLWALLVFYSLAASVFSVWLWMRGLRWVSAPRAGVFMVLLPLTAALVGVVFLGETFTPAHLAASVMALIGLLLATWPQRARS